MTENLSVIFFLKNETHSKFNIFRFTFFHSKKVKTLTIYFFYLGGREYNGNAIVL